MNTDTLILIMETFSCQLHSMKEILFMEIGVYLIAALCI